MYICIYLFVCVSICMHACRYVHMYILLSAKTSSGFSLCHYVYTLTVKQTKRVMLMRNKGHYFAKSSCLNWNLIMATWSPLSAYHLILNFSHVTLISELWYRWLFRNTRLQKTQLKLVVSSSQLADQNMCHFSLTYPQQMVAPSFQDWQ
jgi:hypothetical protein